MSELLECVECGGEHQKEEIYLATGHDREYVCRGCVVQFLSTGEWPHTNK